MQYLSSLMSRYTPLPPTDELLLLLPTLSFVELGWLAWAPLFSSNASLDSVSHLSPSSDVYVRILLIILVAKYLCSNINQLPHLHPCLAVPEPGNDFLELDIIAKIWSTTYLALTDDGGEDLTARLQMLYIINIDKKKMSKYRKQTLNWAEAIISFWRWDEVICRSSGWFWLWLLLWFWLQILLWLQFWRLLYYWTWASSGRQRRRFSLYSWNFYFNHLHVTSITANSWGVFSTRSISTFLIWPSWQWEYSMQPSIMSTKFRKLAEFLGKIYLDTISPPPFQSLHGKHWHLTVLTPHCPSLHHPLQDLQSQHKKDSDPSTLQNITLSFIRFTNFQPPWAWTSWSCLTCTWIGSLLPKVLNHQNNMA